MANRKADLNSVTALLVGAHPRTSPQIGPVLSIRIPARGGFYEPFSKAL
jgi:hypothetical protein